MSNTNLKTGTVKKFQRNLDLVNTDKWVVYDPSQGRLTWAAAVREEIRAFKRAHQRIAKIIKLTPKFVTVEIAK